MQTIIINNIKRFLLIFLLQVLVLKRINLSWESFEYIHLFIFPLLVFLIPIKISRSVQLLIAFTFGLLIDMFYDSPGLHAGTLVFTAFIRKYVLKFLEPVDGYTTDSTPTIRKYGLNWFLIYSSILLFFHLLLYFSLEAFSFVYTFEILLKTVFSFIFSEIIILVYVLILNPK